MRIAYVCYLDAFRDDGVVKKVQSQAARWRSADHAVEILCLSPAAAGRPQALDGRIFAFGSSAERARATLSLSRAARRLRPDVVYLRYDVFLPPPLRLLRAVPTVVEVNTDDRAELARRSRAAALYNQLNRRVLLGSARGIVCVTRELASGGAVAPFGKPTAVVANGAEPPARVLPPAPADGPARVAFIGTPRLPWHGVDKILWLAANARDLAFDLIGPSPADLPGAAPANLTAHGFLERPAYEQVLARADVALGSLALHRNGMHEACPLKVRECLPMVIGYADTDFDGEPPWFLLQLASAEDNVRQGLPRIVRFVEEVRGRRVARAEVEPRLSAEAKERQRLAFLQEVASAR